MISKQEYEALKKQHEEGCKNNDYSKMIMAVSTDPNYVKMQEYEQENVCKHTSIEEIQGGQIERCRTCGKTWG